MLDLDDSRNIDFEHILSNHKEGLIRIRNDEVRNAIIFIHGFRANSLNTWGYKDRYFWPFELCKDLSCRGYCFQYNNPSFQGTKKGALPFEDISKRLLSDLSKEGIDRVLFVTHSFGGLIFKKLLLEANTGDPIYRHVVERVFSASMLTCPNHGHWLAAVDSWIHIGGKLSAPNALLLRRGNRDIRRLDRDFMEKKRDYPNLEIQNVSEHGRMFWIFKVDEESAFATGGHCLRSDGNHSTICKNLNRESQEYKWLLEFANRRLSVADKLKLF